MSFFESFEFLALSVLVFLLATTFLIKRFVKTSKTFYLGSMIKTTRFNPWLDKFTFLGKFLDYMAYAGLVLGFGLLGADFVFARKQDRVWKRILVLAASSAILFAVYSLIFAPIFSSNPGTAQFAFLAPFIFAFFGLAGFILFLLMVNAYDIIGKLSLLL